jgi:hypothetical protein
MMKVIRSHTIARHQQPAGESSFDRVKAVARGSLRDLKDPFVHIPVDLPMHGFGLRIFVTKTRRGHT